MSKKIPKIVLDIRNYKLEDINYGYQKAVSHSQLTLFNKCKHQWALRYKDGNKPFTSNIYSVFGTAMHETIQHFLDVLYNQSAVKADSLDLELYYEEQISKEYLVQYKKNKNQHFLDPKDLREFYDDGVKILRFLKKKRAKYFSKRGWHLVGCEIPLTISSNNTFNNVKFLGYLDVVLYHEPTNEFLILDIKTSTKSWGKWQKKDGVKLSQILLYKYYFSLQFQVPIEKIKAKFFIVKRHLYENIDYAQSRIQEFEPASGKTSINKAKRLLDEFVMEAFDRKGHKDQSYTPEPSLNSCKFCPFNEDKTLCKVGISE